MHYSRQPHVMLRPAFFILLSISVSLAGVLAAPSAAAAPLRNVQSYSITLNAGSTATLDVRGLALQPGSSISADRLALAATPLAADRVRTTLFYAIDWGYTESAPDQVALAVWYAQDGVWRAPEHAIAERIATAASASQGTPSWRPDGRSLLPLVGEQITVQELSLTPVPSSPAIGSGKLTISNRGSQDLMVYLPYGTTFTGPTGSVLVWAAAAAPGQAEPPAQATPTETAVHSDPPAPGETATPSYKNGATPVAESTPSNKVVRSSPTPAEGANLPPVAETASPPEKMQDEPAREPAPTSPPAQAQEAGSNIRSKPQPPAAIKPVEAATPKEKAAPDVAAAPAQPAPPVVEEALPPASIASGPPPELPKAQPTTGNDVPRVPSPVGTQVADKIPPPVATGDAGSPQPTLPAAQQTVVVPIKTTPPTPESKPTSTPIPTQGASQAAGASVDARSATDGSADAKPTPQPAPVASLPTGSDNSPVVTVKSSDGATPSQLPVSSPPANSPATGGGPSSASTWLALCAALLLATGLHLRRLSSPKTAPIAIEQGE